ncbi:MAG: L-seryl-tRNA(Sec) selenium transferase [Peptococcaceae bacterium]|nr:L-seryl-tRNA(Sec) selenium transferase [Peptococcaceae bacterium]
MTSDLYRLIPKMDDLLANRAIQDLVAEHGREQVVVVLRNVLQELRESIAIGSQSLDILISISSIGEMVAKETKRRNSPSLRRVINATGIPLHTNLGRAPLAEQAIAAVVQAARGYSNLEYDLTRGERGSRHDHVRELLREITGCEDAIAVNNNAAAVLLVLSSLAQGKEVVVSRGQLVEVGGSFRIPDVMEQGGALLREVGATNKTHLSDYERVINHNTAALLKVHTSNFRVIGFTEDVSTEALVELSHQHGVLAIEDLGSGVLIAGYGEPTVQEIVATGMDIVTFSGDKLMGGPQAGLIVGKAECIARIRTHPLARALRLDKMTLAALESTLRLYRHAEHRQEIPLVRMLNLSQDDLFHAAEELRDKVNAIAGLTAQVIECVGQVGGGSLPGRDIPGFAVAITSPLSCVSFEGRLRQAEIPVIARILHDRVLLDPRTILPHDTEDLLVSLRKAAGEKS